MVDKQEPDHLHLMFHDPYDPAIGEDMRDRRRQLGLSVQQMAQLAGVTEQTWRNYEAGRTQVRGDKQEQVWDALGWHLPTWEERIALTGIYDDAPTDDLGVPPWDKIPTMLAVAYSPLLASTLGERAARCFALGSFLYHQAVEENLRDLALLPRGAHLGLLDESHIADTLPALWLTRYDYEFVFQMRAVAMDLTRRLHDGAPAPAEPLVRSMAEALVLHDILALGAVIASHDLLIEDNTTVEEEEWEGWVDSLCGPDQPVHWLIATALVPPPNAPEHIDNWFAALERPYVPNWTAKATKSDGGATVTNISNRR